MKKLIAVDPGHGLNTAGKRTPALPDGTVMKEREFNSAAAHYLQTILEDSGFDVLNVAESDIDVPLTTRVALANNKQKNTFNRPADLYVSIHANASADGLTFNEPNGIETFIYSLAAAGSTTEKWARLIHNSLIKATGRRDRGIKRSSLYVVQSTAMPACLIECGFMTNLDEARLLQSDGYRKTIAGAVARGIGEIYNTPIILRAENIAPPPIGGSDVPQWQVNALNTLVSYGIITDPAYWAKRLSQPITAGEVMGLLTNTLK
jgi:N-acetylmuramoyl-L-alanine amidase